MRTAKLTMPAWIFLHDKKLNSFMRLSYAVPILASAIYDALTTKTPSTTVNCVACVFSAALLATPLVSEAGPRDTSLKTPTRCLAGAYGVMFLLYFLGGMKIFNIPKGYDSITDLLGSLLFIAAWSTLSLQNSNPQSRRGERLAQVTITFFIITAAIMKCIFDFKGVESASESARLAINFANGAILLSLYGQLRRLYPPPGPITHVSILLFGCAQIAAHGRDLVTLGTERFQQIVGMSIEWTLLAGKVTLAAYVSYLYFNAENDSRPPFKKVNNWSSDELFK